jgi:acyl-coenzyme A thioesterase 13
MSTESGLVVDHHLPTSADQGSFTLLLWHRSIFHYVQQQPTSIPYNEFIYLERWQCPVERPHDEGASSRSIQNEGLQQDQSRQLIDADPFQYDEMDGKNFLLPWLDIVEIVDAEKLSDTMCKATFRFPVQPEFLNPMGTLHAGATSAFFECATTWTLFPIGKPGFWKSLGICRTISFTYLRPAVVGEVLLMECEVSAMRAVSITNF